jgi:hypothetical protein
LPLTTIIFSPDALSVVKRVVRVFFISTLFLYLLALFESPATFCPAAPIVLKKFSHKADVSPFRSLGCYFCLLGMSLYILQKHLPFLVYFRLRLLLPFNRIASHNEKQQKNHKGPPISSFHLACSLKSDLFWSKKGPWDVMSLNDFHQLLPYVTNRI